MRPEKRQDHKTKVPGARPGFRLAPLEGAKYSNNNRCGGQCKLPEECAHCKQYVCKECGKVYPWENGGTDGIECDNCWSTKQTDQGQDT